MKNGIILLDKADGISSAKAIAQVKAKLHLDKIGHAGTLDPMATGLLVCLAGRATRLASAAQGGKKAYCGVIRLGLTTDSDDITGRPIANCPDIPGSEAVASAARSFVGVLEQVPPKISAVKVDGKRAYKRAREGEEIVLKARTISVLRFELQRLSETDYAFEVECDSGTYIRSIARDLGAKLGCGACLASLRRTVSLPFTVNEAKVLSELNERDVLSWERLFPATPRHQLSKAGGRLFSFGNMNSLSSELPRSEEISQGRLIVTDGSRSLGLLENNQGRWEIAMTLA